MRRAAAAAGLLALLAGGPGAGAEEAVRYGPVPPGIDAVLSSPADDVSAAAAMARAEEAAAAGDAAAALREARALLVLLDRVGLREAARRLARGGVPPALLRHLLVVVASSDAPEADLLLARAAAEPEPDLRRTAAEGLGAGRSAAAVPWLARLAADPAPAVRAAALRSLFALEGPEAVAARGALPADPRDDLLALRLRLHRLRDDASPEVLDLAARAWARGRSAAVRTEAARLLAARPSGVPERVLGLLRLECGGGPLGAVLVRAAHGAPAAGYDDAALREVAIAATFGLLARPDLAEARRAVLVDDLVGWLARPVAMDPRRRDPVPEDHLRMRLPDLGPRLVAPVLRRLRANGFRDARDGVALLRELGPAVGLPALRSLLSEPGVPESVRRAAAGGLASLGVGDEALARRLLAPGEDRVIRRDVVIALGAETGAFAIDLLARELARPDAEFVEEAADALEAHDDPAARRLLEEEVFRRPGNAARRLRPLVAPADDEAYALLGRALADPRLTLRLAALMQFPGTPGLRGARALALVRGYAPQASAPTDRTHEIEWTLYARVAVAPAEGVAFLRERWEELGRLDFQDPCLTILQEARGPGVSPPVVDFALEQATGATGGRRLLAAGSALRGRRGHRDAEIDDVYRRALAHPDPLVANAAASLLQQEGRGDLTAPLLALLEERPGDERKPYEMTDVLHALLQQPLTAAVEARALELALVPTVPVEVRIAAAEVLTGRVSEAGRGRLLARLRDTAAGGGEPEVERAIAAAIGTGAGPATAAALAAMLEEAVLARYATPESLDPESERLDDWSERVAALATGIARAGDAAAMERGLDLVFDARFAAWAQAAVRLHARRLGGDATSAARPRPTPEDLRLATADAVHPMPPEVAALVEEVKTMEDAALARRLDAVLGAARGTGRLALFPDVYLERLLVSLEDPRTTRRAAAAEAVDRHVVRVEPVEGAADLSALERRSRRLQRQGRFADAADAQAAALRTIARRGYDTEDGARYLRARARAEALRGADLAERGLAAAAQEAFSRALLRAPFDPAVLQEVARVRLAAGHDLAAAEALAARAVALERRAYGRESLEAADALAAARLRLGRADEAVALLREHYDPRSGFRAPSTEALLRLAEALAAAGDGEGALAPLRQAIELEPELREALRAVPWAAGLVERLR